MSCHLCAISAGRTAAAVAHKAAARLLQGQKVFVRHPPICLTNTVRLPQEQRAVYWKAAASMFGNVRLQLKITGKLHMVPSGYCTMSHGSLANFARPPCDSLACEREIIVRTSYGCLMFCVILCEFAICLTVSKFCHPWWNRWTDRCTNNVK